MSRIIIGIAGIALSVVTYNIGYNAALSEGSNNGTDATYRSIIEQVSKEKIELSAPVPRIYLENWAEGYYD
jgi:hypothetical protein